jgi:hypothetical protein
MVDLPDAQCNQGRLRCVSKPLTAIFIPTNIKVNPMKTTFKLIIALSALALGFVSTNAYAQAGAAGAGGGRRGGGGAGGRGGAGNLAAPLPTIDALTTALMLTPDEVKGITPILADMTTAQTAIVKAVADYQTARTANIDKITALLTDTQKPLLPPLFNPAPPAGGRRGGAAGAGGGRRGGGNGGAGGAAPAPAPAPAT